MSLTPAPFNGARFSLLLSLSFVVCAPVLCQQSMLSQLNDMCLRARMERPITWLTWALWIDSRSELLVADFSDKALYALHPSGRLASKVSQSRASIAMIPMREYGSDHFMLVDDETRVHWLDRSLVSTGVISLREQTKDSTHPIGSIYDMVAAGGTVVAFGTLRPTGPQDFEMGFFSYRPASPGHGDQGASSDSVNYFLPTSEGLEWYSVGYPFLSTIGRLVYFVAMGRTPDYRYPELYAYDTRTSGLIRLAGIPGENEQLPDFPPFMQPGFMQPAQVYSALEKLETPAGLYSQDGLLYLLERKVNQHQTSWWMTQMKPLPDEDRVVVLGTFRLPVQPDAKFLTIVPTPEAWYVFEKGSVENPDPLDKLYSEQLVQDMMIISSKWIKDSVTSPLYSRNHQIECRSTAKLAQQ